MSDESVASPHLVPFDGTFRIGSVSTEPPDDAPKKKENEKLLEETVARIAKLQPKLHADGRFALLLVFQAMDAAGKDGTIRHVLSGVNPAGCQVKAFKAPDAEELAHDFLWRIQRALPERGIIGVLNRSHYEEVLVVRVNPRFLEGQHLPEVPKDLDALWTQRYESIRDVERHWARNGTVIRKFYLHVSKEEQKKRQLDRIEDPEANWKFNSGDLETRGQWGEYMKAYEAALAATSRPWAPWYAIPADSKSYMRRAVAEIVLRTLESLPIEFPTVGDEQRAEMEKLRAVLLAE